MIGFFVCIGMGLICFILAGFYLPFIVFKARKFCLLFTLGSILWALSLAFVNGPAEHFKTIFSAEKIIFTITYIVSLLSTVYVAAFMKSTILTVIFSIIQILSLVWYISGSFPGGASGIFFFTKGFSRIASQTLPV